MENSTDISAPTTRTNYEGYDSIVSKMASLNPENFGLLFLSYRMLVSDMCGKGVKENPEKDVVAVSEYNELGRYILKHPGELKELGLNVDVVNTKREFGHELVKNNKVGIITRVESNLSWYA